MQRLTNYTDKSYNSITYTKVILRRGDFMSVCTFFGHRDCPSSIQPKLKTTLIDLIENHAVHTFYVGNHGAFDSLVRSTLQELTQRYPHIRCTIVLAYLPTKQIDFPFETLLPDGIETTPKRFAISFRNKWMLKQADFVVTYIAHPWGGAAQFAELAEKQKKTIINLFSNKN